MYYGYDNEAYQNEDVDPRCETKPYAERKSRVTETDIAWELFE